MMQFLQSLHLLLAVVSLFCGHIHGAAINSGRTFDYVVVGSGPGGATVASRLSEDPSVSVAIIEAGQWYEDVVGNQSTVPGYDFRYDGKSPTDSSIPIVDWGFITTPQVGIDNQPYHYVRGKTLGGCSALNYMAYSHSTRGAFHTWANEVGDPSFEYDNDVSKYYRKSMNFTPPNAESRLANATPSYNAALTSTGGPLDISYPAYAQPWSTWVSRALDAIGVENTDAFIKGALEGSSWLMHTINPRNGNRESSETAFLRPYLSRPNLVVFNGTLAERIIFNSDKVATGVEVTTMNTTYTLNVRREVIVSGGTFQSPQFLQVSGVGPADMLRQNGIEVVADRPGVGQHMWDHVFFGIAYKVNVLTGTSLGYGNNMATAEEQFRANATGQLTSPGGDFVGYEKVPQDLRANWSQASKDLLAEFPSDWPELQYLILPNYVGPLESIADVPPQDGFNYATIIATLIAPASRGNVSISSPHMSDQPLINPNWLTAQSDRDVVIAGFKRLRDAMKASEVTIGDEFYPGPSVQTDEQILEQVKRSFNTMYHASSTCKMGRANDTLSVVDNHARVYGVQNVRVVDASAFPFQPPGGAPQSVVYMLAEKISDDIKQGH